MNKQEKCNNIVDFDYCYKDKNKIIDKKIPLNFIIYSSKSDFITQLKEFLKKYSKLYVLLIKIISPVYLFNTKRSYILKKYLNKNAIIINVASGNLIINEEIINIDFLNYPTTDIVTDATNLCLKNDSVDFVINEASLEHIYDYKKVVLETYRILKNGGEAYFLIPFIQGYHSSPDDFYRFTPNALERLFKECGFKVKNISIVGGAASGFLWILTEFLAITMSLGLSFLYNFWFLFFTLILFPIKFLDFFLNRIPFSKNIASVFSIVVEK